MVSLAFPQQAAAAQKPFPSFEFEHEPSEMQLAFYRWIHGGEGNATLIAVAGSGKSTSIINSVLYIPENAYVTVLAFNAPVAAEMRDKIKETAREHGRELRRVQAKTFHSLGYGAVLKHLQKKYDQVEPTDRKNQTILKEKLSREEYKMYGSFCAALVAFAKGEGLGTYLKEETEAAWHAIIAHHDLYLEDEKADVNRAVEIASRLLDYGVTAAAKRLMIDYDDMIYLPIRWDLKLWQNDYLYIDEAQDTNPCRRELARKALCPGGRLIAVGDPNQGIFGFTGASNDAMALIQKQFGCVELPLTVSYRCPKAAEALVRPLVSHFSVWPGAKQGAVSHLSPKKALERLGPNDAIICRNTAPLVELAFSLIGSGRACTILGKDIGKQLTGLIDKMEAGSLEELEEKLEKYAEREIHKYLKKGEEEKAEAVSDRVHSVCSIIKGLKEGQRTVAALCAKIEGMFSDNSSVLTLCTAHKSKGLEWPRVAILEPGLMPSKWARRDHQYQQEKNLMYVAWTRFQDELIFMDGADRDEAPKPALTPPAAALSDDLDIPACLRRT